MDTHHVKAKPVATYTQRLSRSQTSTWNAPALRDSKVIQTPTPQQSFLGYDDEIHSDATSERIVVASHVRSSQSDAILVEDDDDESVVEQSATQKVLAGEIAAQDEVEEEVFESVATDQSGRLFKGFPVEVCSLF